MHEHADWPILLSKAYIIDHQFENASKVLESYVRKGHRELDVLKDLAFCLEKIGQASRMRQVRLVLFML